MSVDVGYLKRKRGILRGQVTRIYTDVVENLHDFERSKILSTISRLKTISSSLKDHDEKINSNIWSSMKPEESEDSEVLNMLDQSFIQCDEYAANISYCLVNLEDKLNTPVPEENLSSTTIQDPNSIRRLKPRVAPLPTYGGFPNESLEKFLFNFESVLGHFEYSEYENSFS